VEVNEMVRKKRKPGYDAHWAEAKRLCRLNAEDVRMAKELGLNPRKLIKNIPSPSQPWKLPVKFWIRELYARKHPGASPGQPSRRQQERTGEPLEQAPGSDQEQEEIPF
jgi:hypothetical protein